MLALKWTPDQLYRVPTADGAAIGLGRYLPRREPRHATPVVLCHGLGANRFDLDFNERYSLAQFLARKGFETWVLELRGRGTAGKAIDTTFDEQAEHDVEAALSTVLSTGATQVFWVGHSKGALVAYAHLAKKPSAPIRALVALGTPVSFDTHSGLQPFLKLVMPALRLGVIPLRLATRPAALWGLPPPPLGSYLANPDNMDAMVMRQAIYNVSADIAGGVARQFARWVKTGAFDADDGFDYRANMKHITVPALLIAGVEDRLAPPSAVKRAAASLGGEVVYRELSRAEGFRADYGHGDLTLGRHAPEEVFPLVAEFLSTH